MWECLEKGGTGAFGVDQGNVVIIPITIAQKQLLGISYFSTALIKGNANYDISFIESRIKFTLRQNHGITDPNKDDFNILTQADILSILGTITSVLTLFLAAIASISLVVGGIGIMNIMLVSVTERTREIGLRKAVGATNNDILQQFLIESVLLTFIGGVIGIAIGAGIVGLVIFYSFNFLFYRLGFCFSYFGRGPWACSVRHCRYCFRNLSRISGGKKNPIDALRYE